MPYPEEAVVDANILIHSRGQLPVDKVVMPPSVEEEIKSEISQLKLEKLNINSMKPSKEVLENVTKKSQNINSPTSQQDEEALALAIDQNLTLITDDKALQNLALHMNAEFEGFNADKVEENRSWKKVCDNCGGEVSSSQCPRCGSRSWVRKRDQRN